MKLWPYEKFEIKTLKSTAQTMRIVEESIDPRRPSITPTKRPFSGKCFNDKLKITFNTLPIVDFRPIINGQVYTQDSGSVISVKIRPHAFSIAFLFLGMIFCALTLILLISSFIVTKEFHIFNLCGAISIGAFFYSVVYFPFIHGSSKAKKLLYGLLGD